AIIAAEALRLVLSGPDIVWLLLVIGAAVALAVIGHDALHWVQRILTYLTIVVFGIFTINALTVGVDPAMAAAMNNDFMLAPFLTQFGVAAAYMIGFAVYISDYSRYLPKQTSTRSVIGWTYLGHI